MSLIVRQRLMIGAADFSGGRGTADGNYWQQVIISRIRRRLALRAPMTSVCFLNWHIAKQHYDQV
jgi:hypothetical protein